MHAEFKYFVTVVNKEINEWIFDFVPLHLGVEGIVGAHDVEELPPDKLAHDHVAPGRAALVDLQTINQLINQSVTQIIKKSNSQLIISSS